MGSSKNFLVVDEEKSAIEAINYLKNEKLGRATFLPINIIKGKNIPQEIYTKLKKVQGFIDSFNKLVTFEKKYQNIIDNQLGNVLVVNDADSLKDIAKLVDYKYKIVTLSGEISNIGGSLTGGTFKPSNTLMEKNELTKLKENLTNYNINIRNTKFIYLCIYHF